MKRILVAVACLAGAPAWGQSAAVLFGETSVVAPTDLAAITGKADTMLAIEARNSSTVSHNAVIGNSETGGISFDAQAMQNMSGLSLLSANTGNNVSINSSLNLNVAIHP